METTPITIGGMTIPEIFGAYGFHIAVVVITFIICYDRHMKKDPKSRINNFDPLNFNTYRKDHPECVTDRGVKCCYCGGKHIWCKSPYVENVGGMWIPRRYNAHICSTCGAILYYSGKDGRDEYARNYLPARNNNKPNKVIQAIVDIFGRKKRRPGDFL